ncbi:unnamed protein product [Arctia plantaginis]|uniref:RNA-directed DNA polymerase n=1 Tax=Arctia plantaginis TaxID=874455 RepID=A0A8S1B0I5_ARCPL|nr:unnamed protein product [Arctia plantaginis]
MPTPTCVKDVERFLGLVTYVGNFIPNLSDKTCVLRELLKKDIEWHWTNKHNQCFNEIKCLLVNPPVLQFYDPRKPVVISVDASKNGLGACLLQTNLPVCYASKALTKTEQSYAQIEKELYACVFACERFYTYIYGRTEITIETDHKPLVNIINKPLANAPARLQRMLMRLQPYTFTLVYKPGRYLYIADTLSRAVAPSAEPVDSVHSRNHYDAQAQVCSISASNVLTDTHFVEIQKSTLEDEDMQLLIKTIKRGWPVDKSTLDNKLKPFWECKEELVVNFGIVWRGCRVVIPKSMRYKMLKNIHSSHLGIEKCKLRARQIMYWPNMNTQLIDYLSKCQACLNYRKQNIKEPLIPHEIPDRPWCKVGIDIFHLGSKSYLIAVDYHSKFIELAQLNSSTSENVINKLKTIFGRQGIPETVMSDNGPEFSSLAFSDFARNWKFRHVTSSPRYPQSNGQVERSIQTIKQIIRKTAYDQSDFNLALLEYLNTPISKELPSPAELLYSRKLRSIVPCNPILLKPTLHNNTAQKIKSRQQIQKYYYDRGSKNLTPLCVGQKVKVRINNTWQSGIVKNRFGMRSYVVLLNNGTSLRRNRRHLIADSNRNCLSPQNEYSLLYDDINLDTSQSTSVGSGELVLQSADDNCSNAYRTRFGRIVRPPDRWGYSKNRNSIGECK